ncbi:hypothetical protein D7X32_08990 [Corallococcus carmarthensis]|uniref:Uncharacterized protein n=1 Tax=Corallococcus carmarthensis TaxID=2316728 RepID=A0A3A8KST2_9BACT|nr:hypothetical protein D7X32_08990 [Corallococcus carmarthensis]
MRDRATEVAAARQDLAEWDQQTVLSFEGLQKEGLSAFTELSAALGEVVPRHPRPARRDASRRGVMRG